MAEKWRRIETAPMDGETDVIVWSPHHARCIVALYTWDNDGRFSQLGWVDAVDGSPLSQITHWMPAPQNPKLEAMG